MIAFHQPRRQFIGKASCAAVSSIPVLNTLLNLSFAEKISALTAPASGEYRAVVCLFLSGGCDSFNVLVPRETSAYAQYQATRSDLALAPGSLIDIHPTGQNTFAVHGGMPEVAALFEAGHGAFIANVGTLIEPVQNRSQITALTKKLPLGLYSHSDQIEQWQTSLPNQRSGIGWAGRTADLLQGLNANQKVPMNISLDGSNVWQTGHSVAEYAITTDGAVALDNYSAGWQQYDTVTQAFSQGMDSQLALQYSNILMQTFNTRKKAALDAYNAFTTATSAPLPGGIVFPSTYVGSRLQMIAQAIQGHASSALGAVRQTFFINFGGWDHHSGVLNLQGTMLPQISAAIGAFYNQLAAMNLQNQVVLYTASDFGRTLTSNGQGSDHAWGSNQLIVGGGVKGKHIYGSFPSLAINPDTGPEQNPLDTGNGRLIPTTSCDQFFAELALWLGVSPTDLPLVLPNIGNFYTPSASNPPLGFMM